MIPVMQQQMYDPDVDGSRGDCLSACLASILELPLSEVPIFQPHEGCGAWYVHLQRWLADRGLRSLWFHTKDEGILDMPGSWDERDGPLYFIASGNSPRGDWHHATVWSVDSRGCRMVHDPHPDGTGIVIDDETTYHVLVPWPQTARTNAALAALEGGDD